MSFLIKLLTVSVVAAQSDTKSLLWKVSGNGLEKPSYLFGTLHMMCSSDFVIKDKVTRALESADRYVIEADIFSPAAMKEMQAADASPIPQSKRLSPDQSKMIDSVLRKYTKMTLSQVDNSSLFTISGLMIYATYPCTDLKMYEAELLKMAMQRKMKVDTLETITAQMRFLQNAYTDEYALAKIQAFEEYKAFMDGMVKIYKEENLPVIYNDMTSEKFMDTNAKYWMLHVRNVNWANKMPDMMKKGSNFFAVGAGHLGGDDGLIKLLQAKGYTVEPILN
ncbi:TraB/GumN family protein [Chitinophaga dinghuensis]|nr:TraB/GumN family protein [Chitinophaga dinghuensis]